MSDAGRARLEAMRDCVGDALRGRRYRTGNPEEDEAAVHEALTEAVRVCAAKTQAVYGLAAPGEAPGPAAGWQTENIDLEGECTPDDHLKCDTKVALGVAHDVSCELSLPGCGKLSEIVEGRYTNAGDARQALEEFVQEVRQSPRAGEDEIGWADVVESEVLARS